MKEQPTIPVRLGEQTLPPKDKREILGTPVWTKLLFQLDLTYLDGKYPKIIYFSSKVK